jgi:predicted nucleotidyltransferase
MNQETTDFIGELKQRPDVLGIILFGSWARGNHRPESDVDLVVILENGYQRTIERRNQQVFEIIYITPAGGLEYWNNHKDNAADLWEVAKILYDKDGTIERLRDESKKVLESGKTPINALQREQFRFDAEDQLKYVATISDSDPTTANFILMNKVFALTGLFFDLRQSWTPAPKQRLAKIKDTKSEFYSLLNEFYRDGAIFNERLSLAKRMVPIIFA